MTKKSETKISQPMGERGRFYFTPILITLKKFLRMPESLRQCKAQSATEYFVILCAVLAISLLSVSSFYPAFHKVAESFFNKAVEEITREGEACDSVFGVSGTIVYDGQIRFCKVSGSTCPGDLVPYKNFSATSFTTCQGMDCSGQLVSYTSGDPGYHTWGDFPYPEKTQMTNCISLGPKQPCSCSTGYCTAETTQIGCVNPVCSTQVGCVDSTCSDPVRWTLYYVNEITRAEDGVACDCCGGNAQLNNTQWYNLQHSNFPDNLYGGMQNGDMCKILGLLCFACAEHPTSGRRVRIVWHAPCGYEDTQRTKSFIYYDPMSGN